jgi:hypothetical protein
LADKGGLKSEEIGEFLLLQKNYSTSLKVVLSQRRLENFFVARINIPNDYPGQKI